MSTLLFKSNFASWTKPLRFRLRESMMSSPFRYHHSIVCHPVPSFSATALVNGEFKKINSQDYKGKYWVLFFYPLDFTFVCPTEILAFSDRMKEFDAIGTAVIGCSVDSEYSHLAWTSTPRAQGGLGQKLAIPLLSDLDKSIASRFGVLLDSGIALRGLFIMDPKGMVRQSTINDLPIGRSVDETLRLVKALQYTDQHGEVCPANWTPGSESMVPTPKESKKYFEKNA